MVDYDMHIHSKSSDGLLDIEQIFQIARDKGLKGISITDHDTVDGLHKALSISSNFKLDFIPGIELSTDYEGVEVHILGYYIDPENSILNEFLDKFKQSRKNRSEEMIIKLRSLGYDIDIDDVYDESGRKSGVIGRPHIARALVKKGYFDDMTDVFNGLIGYDKPAYVERYKVSAQAGIRLILDSGGIPVLAHPRIVRRYSDKNLIYNFIKKLTYIGLKGIEVYHSKHETSDSDILKSIAISLNLAITGGSDCHGKVENGEYLLGTKGINEDCFNDFIKLRR